MLATAPVEGYNAYNPQYSSGRGQNMPQRLISLLKSKVVTPTSLGEREQAAIYRFCRKAVLKKQRQIVAEVRMGRIRVARKKQNELLRSLPARVLASREAIYTVNRRRLDRPTGLGHPISFPGVWNLAERVRRNLASQSWGVARLKPKGNNQFREVVSFTAFDIARQNLVAMSIKPFVGLHPSQYLLRGGRTAACEALLSAMNAAPEGARFLHVDVNNYHGSISHDWLRENLPMSTEVTQQVILLDGMSNVLRWHLGLAHQHKDEGTDGMGRRGIPQGSVVSSIVAEYVMADILRTAAVFLGEFSLFNYSDNLGILVPRAIDEAAFMERLSAVFQTHPAGPFQIRLVGSHDLREPFGFLGYHWQMQNEARAFVPEGVAMAREINFQRDLLEAETEEQRLKIEHSIRSYCAAFSLWDGALEMQNRLISSCTRQLSRLRG